MPVITSDYLTHLHTAFASQFPTEPPQKLAVFTSKKPAAAAPEIPIFTVKTVIGLTADAEKEMAEIAARIADPQDFDDAFLAAQMEAIQTRIIGTMNDQLEQTIMDAIATEPRRTLNQGGQNDEGYHT